MSLDPKLQAALDARRATEDKRQAERDAKNRRLALAFEARRPVSGDLNPWFASMTRKEAGAIMRGFYVRKPKDTPKNPDECDSDEDLAAFHKWKNSKTDVETCAFDWRWRKIARTAAEKTARADGRVLRKYTHSQTAEGHREKDRLRQAKHRAQVAAQPKTIKTLEEIENIKKYEREKKAAQRAKKKAAAATSEHDVTNQILDDEGLSDLASELAQAELADAIEAASYYDPGP